MAVTFAASNLTRDVCGAQRRHTATITCTGTTSDNGDAFSPSLLGLAVLDQLLVQNALDSQSNPENSFVAVWDKSLGSIVFCSQATAGATTPLGVITDGTSVANYVFNVEGIGR